MTRGAVLFAFNSDTVNYYDTAVFCAERIDYFLNLPVTLITDEKSLPEEVSSIFDKVITVEAQADNQKKTGQWINKGRYRAYQLTPYDETLVLDTDYVVNSDQLSNIFDMYDDFMCAKNADYLMFPDAPKDIISNTSFDCPWATVMAFKKTDKARQIFECIEMVQNNYQHYSNLYGFAAMPFRNDYALAIALHIVYGGIVDNKVYMPWNLIHVSERVKMYRVGSGMDTNFVATKKSKRTEYIKIKNTDFHMLFKPNFIEIVNG